MQKRVLIICYYWPPSGGSGVQRWLKFVKYLPEFGWQPVVYTPENPDFEIIDESLMKDIPPEAEILKRKIWEPYAIGKLLTGQKNMNKGIVNGHKAPGMKKKLLNWVRGNLFIPDPRVFWVKPSIRFLLQYLEQNPVDIIITTGPPHSMHLIGEGLKEKTGIPWIADFRDPWSQLDFLDSFNVSARNRKRYEQMESRVLKKCDLVLATSPSMHKCLMPFNPEKFKCITHGYDESDFTGIKKNRSETGKIRIYHAGLLNSLRNPVNLWESLNALCEKDKGMNDRVEIHLAGTIDTEVVKTFSNYPYLKNKLKIEAYKSHNEVIQDYLNSDLLLLLVNNSANAKVNIPGKLFEYLASDKSILLIGNTNSDTAEIVMKNKAGLIYDYNESIDPGDIKLLLEEPGRKRNIDRSAFSRKALTSDLVDVFKQLFSEEQ